MRQTARVITALVAVAAATLLPLASPAEASTATTTTLASSANPAAVGDTVTLTATVAADGGGTPTGSVVFTESGGVTLGSADLAGGVATLAVGGLAAGTHALTATYNGDGTNDLSYGTLTQTMTAPVVAPPPPPVTVKPPKITLKASTTKTEVGDKVRLMWRSKRADSVKASGDWGGSMKTKGFVDVRITERGTHVFRLTVQNAAGAKSAVAKVVATRKAKELELVVPEDPVDIGDKVEVTADGLAKAESFTLRLGDKVIATGKADGHGVVTRTFVVPKGTAPGEVDVTITGSNPGRVGTAVLNVIGPAKLDVSASAPEIYKREEQTIAVTGLLPGEAYTVTVAGKKLTQGTADAAGTFTYSYKVGKPLGSQTVTVTGSLPTRTGSATYTVLDPGRGPNNGG